jgi:N-acetylneuraminate synthase
MFTITGRLIGPGHPAYIVAELSGNHGHDFGRAVELVHAAHEAGADAIKLQTYTPDTITIPVRNEYFRIGGGTLWDGQTLYELYQEAYTPWEWQPKLKQIANKLGMDLFSSSFDASAVDFLEQMDVPVHKIASFELVDIPLIRKAASTGKPLILATGMATLAEIQEAIVAARDAGAQQIALLKCCSAYPAPPEEMNLRCIPEWGRDFECPIGLSDHTLPIAVPVTAVALGACIVERHFTLSRSTPGPDSAFSSEPGEFKAMVEAIRVAEKALGELRDGPTEQESKSRVFRRSLFVVMDIKAGDMLTPQTVRSIRPGYGLHPRHLTEVLGRVAARDLASGTPLTFEDLRPAETTRPSS